MLLRTLPGRSGGWMTILNPSQLVVFILLIGICLIGLLLRVHQLAGNFYSDEIWIFTTAISPFPVFAREFLEDWVHPPLFHFAVRAWVYLIGTGELSGRLIAVTFGVLSIPLIYWLGREILGPKTGLVAAALLALSPVHIYHSQYGRHYSLFVFFVLLSMVAFLKVYDRLDSWRYGVFYILSNVLLVYTHYFGWLIILCQSLFFLSGRVFHFRRWVLLQALIVVAYIPWVYLIANIFFRNSLNQQAIVPHITWIKPPSLWKPVHTLSLFNGELPIQYQGRVSLLLLGGISLLSLKGVFCNDKYREAVLFLFSCVIVPFVLVFVVSHTVQPIWILRAMLVSLPAYYLLIAVGSQRIKRKAISFSLVLIPLLWISLAVSSYSVSKHRMPFEEIVSYLEKESEGGIPILVQNNYLMNSIFFYYNRKEFLYQLHEESNTSLIPVSQIGSVSEILTRIGRNYNKLIVATYIPSRRIEIHSELSPTYRVVKEKEFFGYGEEGQRRKVSIFFYEKELDRV
jgi:uncharacterized membrane protein